MITAGRLWRWYEGIHQAQGRLRFLEQLLTLTAPVIAGILYLYACKYEWKGSQLVVTFPQNFKLLQWETMVGLAVTLAAFALPRMAQWTVRRTQSIAMVPVDQLGGGGGSVPRWQWASTKPEFAEVAELLGAAYPRYFVTEEDLRSTRDKYVAWAAVQPRAVMLIRNDEGQAVGVSVALRVKVESYREFRNGMGKSWGWSRAALESPGTAGDCVIFAQAAYCSARVGAGHEAGFTELVLRHWATVWADRASRVVILGARATERGCRNLEILGFESARRSEAGFPIYELDSDRAADLAEAARETLAYLRAAPSWP